MSAPKDPRDWNGGRYTGANRTQPRPRKFGPVVDACGVVVCGTPGSEPSPRPRMARIEGAGEGGQSAWYCPGRCTAIARARADLRSDGHLGGER